ncbi:MAG: hypothetical protein RR012_01250 [Oscillospiraceae bacterium]
MRHNQTVGGMFHCGPDDRVFGYMPKNYDLKDNQYNFNNEHWINEYLQAFENGEINISERYGIAIYDLFVKGRMTK